MARVTVTQRQIQNYLTSRRLMPTKDGSLSQMYFQYVRDALRRELDWSLKFVDFVGIVTKECAYCGMNPYKTNSKSGDVLVNGVDRKDNDKGYCLPNVVPCCSICNKMKGTLDHTTFIRFCKMIAGKAISDARS